MKVKGGAGWQLSKNARINLRLSKKRKEREQGGERNMYVISLINEYRSTRRTMGHSSPLQWTGDIGDVTRKGPLDKLEGYWGCCREGKTKKKIFPSLPRGGRRRAGKKKKRGALKRGLCEWP